MDDFKGKRVVVAGLGRFGGGTAVTRWLVEQGARVLVTDTASAEALDDSVREIADLQGIEYHLGGHRDDDFTSADLIVASPAVPPKSKYLSLSRAADVPITTEIRLFIERCPARIAGVTGTKGKSTTTALLGLMLARRHATHVGGNIGKSLLATLPRIKKEDLVVLELSSFMLEYIEEARWSPHVAVVTMIAPDHIDRHGDMANYIEAKKNIVRFQKPSDIAVLNETCHDFSTFAAATPARVIAYGRTIAKPFNLKLPGAHNQLNAQAAFAAAQALDVTWEDAQEAIRLFAGLPHRLELVHEHNGVKYYNDSIATIPVAAATALEAFAPKTVLQIVGGYDKKIALTPMYAPLVERAKAVLCIGQTGPAIADALEQSTKTGGAQIYRCGDLKTAVQIASANAAPGDTILLSTGCASYDQFRNFEERGKEFARLARELK
jgi:UDP-N-acetylmuramoylalanine--D-glutamate ligase